MELDDGRILTPPNFHRERLVDCEDATRPEVRVRDWGIGGCCCCSIVTGWRLRGRGGAEVMGVEEDVLSLGSETEEGIGEVRVLNEG